MEGEGNPGNTLNCSTGIYFLKNSIPPRFSLSLTMYVAVSHVHHAAVILIFALENPNSSCRNDCNHQALDVD